MIDTDHRYRRATRRDVIIGVVLLGLVGVVTWQQVRLDDKADRATEQRDATAEQSLSLSDRVLRACAEGGATAARLRQLGTCGAAGQVQVEPVPGEPGEPGERGPVGPQGRGISSTSITPTGDLIIAYTDGTTENKGRVVGRDGRLGPSGRGIASTSLTAGRLVLAYTDGSTEVVGAVVGPAGAAGADGKDGAPGRSVDSVTVNAERHLIVRYSDGTSADAGTIPTVAGPPGPQGPAGPTCPAGSTLVSRVIDPDGLGAEPMQTWYVCVIEEEP